MFGLTTGWLQVSLLSPTSRAEYRLLHTEAPLRQPLPGLAHFEGTITSVSGHQATLPSPLPLPPSPRQTADMMTGTLELNGNVSLLHHQCPINK